MPVFSQTAMDITVDAFGLQVFANEAMVDVIADEVDFTTFTSGGWRAKGAGLARGTCGVKGFQDYATTGVDVQFPLTGLGGVDVFTVGPFVGTQVAGDPAFMGQGPLTGLTPLSGAVGDPGMFAFSWAGAGRLVRGKYLHPSAARVASGTGTAVTCAPPTASQALYATFHVLSVTGTGTITFAVQTDDNAGFTSATTRITSSTFAAVGRQFASLAGAIAAETHVRVSWTISGFTSVTFVAAAGVL